MSIGVATYTPGQDVIGPDWLLGQADQALYAAKHLGRNRVVSTDTMLMELARAHCTRLQTGKAPARRRAGAEEYDRARPSDSFRSHRRPALPPPRKPSLYWPDITRNGRALPCNRSPSS